MVIEIKGASETVHAVLVQADGGTMCVVNMLKQFRLVGKIDAAQRQWARVARTFWSYDKRLLCSLCCYDFHNVVTVCNLIRPGDIRLIGTQLRVKNVHDGTRKSSLLFAAVDSQHLPFQTNANRTCQPATSQVWKHNL